MRIKSTHLVILALLWAPSPSLAENWTVSYYKHGKITANGEAFDPMGATCAHRSLPFGALLRLTASDGTSVICRVNDRGPFVPGRELDVSLGLAQMLGMLTVGVMHLDITRVGG
jgi:rare lipoprotein A